MKRLLTAALLVFLAGPAFGQSTLRGKDGICDPSNPNTCYTTPSLARIQSAATTNATSVKTTAASLAYCSLGNNGAAAAYFKIYNKASAPTVGTDTPVATIIIPVGGVNDFSSGFMPVPLSAGFAYAITVGAADTDVAAVAANQVVGFCAYN